MIDRWGMGGWIDGWIDEKMKEEWMDGCYLDAWTGDT